MGMKKGRSDVEMWLKLCLDVELRGCDDIRTFDQ